MTQPPPTPANPWDELPDVDPQGNPVEQSSTAPWEAAPDVPAPATESGYTHPMARFGSGAVSGFARAFNPVEIARSLKAAAILGYKLAKPPVLGQPYAGAEAVGEIAGIPGAMLSRAAESPEGLGDIAGGLAAAAVTPGALESTGAKIANLARRSRVTNIVRAVKGGKELVPIVAKAGDVAELPVSLTQGSLARQLAARETAAGEAVGVTKAALPGTVPASDIAGRLPVVGEMVEGIPIAADRGLRRAVEGRRAYWEGVATEPGFSGEIPRATVANLKEAAQSEAARGGAYAKGGIGLPIAPGAKAAAEEATALRSAVLDTAGLSPADAALVAKYEKALGESSLATGLSEPAQMEHLRRVSGAGGGDWKAALAGRVLAPGLLGGTGAAALGGAAASPLGALAGIGVAEFMKSTPWQTLSAAAKLKAIKALESGGVAAFREAVIPAVIADVTRRRSAERVLQAQGEGVTAP